MRNDDAAVAVVVVRVMAVPELLLRYGEVAARSIGHARKCLCRHSRLPSAAITAMAA